MRSSVSRRQINRRTTNPARHRLSGSKYQGCISYLHTSHRLLNRRSCLKTKVSQYSAAISHRHLLLHIVLYHYYSQSTMYPAIRTSRKSRYGIPPSARPELLTRLSRGRRTVHHQTSGSDYHSPPPWRPDVSRPRRHIQPAYPEAHLHPKRAQSHQRRRVPAIEHVQRSVSERDSPGGPKQGCRPRPGGNAEAAQNAQRNLGRIGVSQTHRCRQNVPFLGVGKTPNETRRKLSASSWVAGSPRPLLAGRKRRSRSCPP